MTHHWNGPTRYTGTPAYRIPDGDTVHPPVSPGPGYAAAQAHLPIPSADALEVRDALPGTVERVIYGVAAVVSVITNVVILYTLWQLYLFVDRLGEALRQFGEQIGQL